MVRQCDGKDNCFDDDDEGDDDDEQNDMMMIMMINRDLESLKQSVQLVLHQAEAEAEDIKHALQSLVAKVLTGQLSLTEFQQLVPKFQGGDLLHNNFCAQLFVGTALLV